MGLREHCLPNRFQTCMNEKANVGDRQARHLADLFVAQLVLKLQPDHLLLTDGQCFQNLQCTLERLCLLHAHQMRQACH